MSSSKMDILELFRITRHHRNLPAEYFDSLTGPPVAAFLNPEELDYIRWIVNQSDLVKKDRMMKELLHPKHFRKMSNGTNRMVYRHLENDTFVLKIGYDKTGVPDSLAEMRNQVFLKPYVCKIFDVTPDGMVATIEKVVPFRTVEDFEVNSRAIFNLIHRHFLGEYVAEDIGKESFKNYGIRPGFGPVLLDYPYFYRIDPDKLRCSCTNARGERCNGMIDYDDGFNHLYCSVCGHFYAASDLEDRTFNDTMMLKGTGRMRPMRVRVKQGDETLFVTGMQSDTIITKNPEVKKENKLRVSVRREYSDGTFDIIKSAYDDDEQPKEKKVEAPSTPAPDPKTQRVVTREGYEERLKAFRESSYDLEEEQRIAETEGRQTFKTKMIGVPHYVDENQEGRDSTSEPAAIPESNDEGKGQDEDVMEQMSLDDTPATQKRDGYEKNKSKFSKNRKKGFKRDHYAYNPYDGGEY